MAWNAPMTAIAKTGFSDVEYNKFIRDNLLCTAPALATATGQVFISKGANALVARSLSKVTVATSETTTSTTYVSLTTAGPSITATTGTDAIAWYSAMMSNSTANASCSISVKVSGGVSIPASNSTRTMIDGRPTTEPSRVAGFRRWSDLKPNKSHTFDLKYSVSAGTGTFSDRVLIVWPL